MNRRPLGSTGLEVSPLGLGTVKFGRNQGVKYPSAFDLPDDAAIASLLDLAKDLGVNLLDTAPAYGTSEERLGPHLARRDRDDWVIVSKVGEEFVDGESAFDFSAEHTVESVERSLRRLGVEHLDVVLVHSDGDDLRVLDQEGVVEALQGLKQRGLVRALGASTKTVAGGLRALELLDMAMVTFNPSHQEERPVIQAAAEAGKGILIKKGLASGHLDFAGEDPLDAGVRFLFSEPGVSSWIVGTLNPDHLRANVAAVERHAG